MSLFLLAEIEQRYRYFTAFCFIQLLLSMCIALYRYWT